MSEYGSIEKLRLEHQLDEFDCGRDVLNRLLKRQAWANQQSNSAQTYVLAKELSVLGYCSLAAGSVAHDEAPERVRKGQVRHPIPVILLARLAVDGSVTVGGSVLRSSRMPCFAPPTPRRPSAPGRYWCMPKTTTRRPSMNTSRSTRVRATRTTSYSS